MFYGRFLQLNLCDFYCEWIMCIFSERSENVKSRRELNPGHVPEIKDCPGKTRTNGHLRQCAIKTNCYILQPQMTNSSGYIAE